MITAEELNDVAQKLFGIPKLYSYQEETILELLNSPQLRLVLLPTGAGKSLIFSLPTFFLKGLTVIVYPLLALMDDQKRRFTQAGLKSLVLRGGQTKKQRQELWAALDKPQPPILITNPEMLTQKPIVDQLKSFHIDHLVFDEAHCISQWGKTFRQAYWEAARLALDLKPIRLTALTATMDDVIEQDVAKILFRNQYYTKVVRVPDRPNITYEVWRGLSRQILLRQALQTAQRPLIIFVSSRIGTVNVARIASRSIPAELIRIYHAGLTREEKTTIESWFFQSDDGVLVTTCAYGMGVDKANIRTVIHWDPSESIVAYLQESGRAGRDGKASRALLLVDPESQFKSQLDRELAFDDQSCRRAALLKALGPYDVVCQGCDTCRGTRFRDTVSWKIYHEYTSNQKTWDFSSLFAIQLWGRPNPHTRHKKLHLSSRWKADFQLSLEELLNVLENTSQSLDYCRISDYIYQK